MVEIVLQTHSPDLLQNTVPPAFTLWGEEYLPGIADLLGNAHAFVMEDALILFFEETVRLGRIPFEYTVEDLEEVRRWEKMMNDDLCDV